MLYSRLTDSLRDNLRSSFLVLLFFLLSALFLTSCSSTKPLTNDQKILSNLLFSARSAYDADNYSDTVKYLTKSLVLAENVAPDKIHKIRKRLSNVYLDWGRSLYWKSKSENNPEYMMRAILLCETALAVNPSSKRKCATYLARFRSDLASIRYKNSTALKNLDQAFAERRYKVDLLIKQAMLLTRARNYMSAKDKLEEVLRLDPYNIKATRDLSKLMKRIARAGAIRTLVDKEGRDAELAWKNVVPIERKTIGAIDDKLNSALDLQTSLNNLELTEINFKDTPLENVFPVIEEEIRNSVSKTFKFNYKAFNPSDDKWPLISFKAKNVPVLGALRAICDGIGLSISISNDAIDISPR